MKKLFGASLLAAGLTLTSLAQAAPTLLNVSYDVMRDFYTVSYTHLTLPTNREV